jgi:metal-sulfur cluster biosynthetic enzyme
MSGERRFEYEGEPALLAPITKALKDVVDPEMALDVVELGLVYRVEAAAQATRVRITMTSAACPVTEYIVEEVGHAVRKARPAVPVDVELTWDPPWTPDRMSEAARSAMGWE